MGIYVFSKDILVKYLDQDELNPQSNNDFGKNIIPAMLEDGLRMFAYPFEGYWKDVGTIDSLWQANMDLLGSNPVFNLRDPDFKIYSRNEARPPHWMGEQGKTINSLVTEGCEIEGFVDNCVLSSGVKVCRGAYVKDSVIMSDVVIGEGSVVNYSIIDSDIKLGKKCVVGRERLESSGVTVISGGMSLPDGTVVEDGAMADMSYFRNRITDISLNS